MDLTQLLIGVVRTKACRIKSEAGGESKQLNLSLDYSDCSGNDILTKAVAHDVIAWQNGQGRKHFASFVNGQTVKVKASKPGAAVTDTVADYTQRYLSMSAEERAAEIARLKSLSS